MSHQEYNLLRGASRIRPRSLHKHGASSCEHECLSARPLRLGRGHHERVREEMLLDCAPSGTLVYIYHRNIFSHGLNHKSLKKKARLIILVRRRNTLSPHHTLRNLVQGFLKWSVSMSRRRQNWERGEMTADDAPSKFHVAFKPCASNC